MHARAIYNVLTQGRTVRTMMRETLHLLPVEDLITIRILVAYPADHSRRSIQPRNSPLYPSIEPARKMNTIYGNKWGTDEYSLPYM